MIKRSFLIVQFTMSVLSLHAQQVFTPNNLIAVFDDEKRVIHLSWDPSQSKVAGYNLFVNHGNGDSFYLWGKAGLIYETSFDYPVFSKDGATFEFKVCSVQNFPEVIRSDYSNIIRVEIPSSFLPMVKLNKPVVKKKIATISWGFSSKAADLDGFIIYLDKDEIKVPKEVRNYAFNELTSGNHTVFILAISKTGLKGAPSSKKFITIK